MKDCKYLIVGNGIAGISAAQELRHADPDGRILVVGNEKEPYYYRASLSEWMAGEIEDHMLSGRTTTFYRDMRLEQLVDNVTRIDAATKMATLEDGDSIRYQKLLIATGARANIFPIDGLNDIHVYRTIADVRKIKSLVGCCGKALILGGGILGLELAGALHRMGIEQIAVVQRQEFVGGPLLNRPAAEWIQARIRADGIDLFTGDTVERIAGQGAHLKSGRTCGFDVLIESVGITPVFPQVKGLSTGRGIQIDAHCRTNLSGIYAAGDCTETRVPGSNQWRTTRVWLDCARQGRVAGRNMAGSNESLPNTPFFNASLIYTVFYAYIGEPHGEDGQVYVWQEGNGYRKVRVVDGKLVGALLLGQRHGSLALLKAIGQPVPEFRERIAHPEFPFNELTSGDWDYLWY